MLELLPLGRADMDRLPQEIAAHPQQAPGHDVVERRHAPKQRDILEGAGDALRRGLVGAHAPAGLSLPGDRARLRVIEAVDDVQHRGLAGAVRPDDREDLVTPDLDADAVERGDPAKGEADPVGRRGSARRSALHPQARPILRRLAAAGSGNAVGEGSSRHVADRQLGAHVALRPSSKVISVSMPTGPAARIKRVDQRSGSARR